MNLGHAIFPPSQSLLGYFIPLIMYPEAATEFLGALKTCPPCRLVDGEQFLVSFLLSHVVGPFIPSC